LGCPRIFRVGRARTKGGRAERAEVPGYDSPGAHGGRRRWEWEEDRREEKSFRREHERRGEERSRLGLSGRRKSLAIACGQFPL
jgi:hypothetical protein